MFKKHLVACTHLFKCTGISCKKLVELTNLEKKNFTCFKLSGIIMKRWSDMILLHLKPWNGQQKHHLLIKFKMLCFSFFRKSWNKSNNWCCHPPAWDSSLRQNPITVYYWGRLCAVLIAPIWFRTAIIGTHDHSNNLCKYCATSHFHWETVQIPRN